MEAPNKPARTACYFTFGLLVSFSFIYCGVDFSRLFPATCQVEKQVNGTTYKVRVIPEGRKDKPFSKTVNVTGLQPNDTLSEGHQLQCFYRINRDEGYGRTTFVQFDSDRRGVNPYLVGIGCLIAGASLVFVFYKACMKQNIAA